MPKPIFYVIGNHGTIEVDLETRVPVNFEDEPEPGDEPYSSYGIIRFDVEEYQRFWSVTVRPGDTVDICELGYWYKKPGADEQYEKPCDTMSRQAHTEFLTASVQADSQVARTMEGF